MAIFTDLEPDDVRSCSMGANGEDVILSPAARRLFPWSVECKARAKASIQTDYAQSASNTPKGSSPLLITKVDRCEPLVTMAWVDFERLIRGQS